MGIFSKLLGNADSVNKDELQSKYGQLLIELEEIELGFNI